MAGPPPPLLAGLFRIIRAILGSLILAGVGLNFANVVGRYVFLRPIIWAEEVLVFIMIWCVLLGATLVTWEGRHLRMEVLYNIAPAPLRWWLRLFTTLVFLAVALFVLVASAAVVRLIARTGQVSVVAEIPMVIPYSAIPVSFALIVVLLAWRFRAFVRGEVEAELAIEAEDRRERFD